MMKTVRRGPSNRVAIVALLRRFALIFILGIAGVSAAGVPPASAQSYSFSKIQIEGNGRISAATILTYLGIAKGETVSAATLNDGYQRIVGSGLFEQVDLVPQGRTLVVRVQEFPTINRISIEGNKRLKDDALNDFLQSKPRHVYSPSVAETDAATIVEAYQAQGRIAASVEPRIIRRSNNRVDLIFEVIEGRNVEVERLSFVGNREFSDRRLRRVMETKQAGLLRTFVRNDTFSADRIEFDKQVLADFYLSRGYVDFQILSVSSELARERDAFFVTFHVQEGQSYKFGEITTTSDVPEADAAEFHEHSKLRSGVTYNPALVENTIARLERLAVMKGINFVRIEPVVTRNDRNLTLDIELRIVRGPRILVERIDIEGNATTLDRVVRNQFTIVEGDPFNPREIRAAAERIRALGYFADAAIEAREGSAPGQVVIDVDVEEAPSGSFSFGGTYSMEQGLGANIDFTETNFLGRGQTLNLSLLAAADNGTFSFSFIEPHLLDRDLAFGISAFYTQTKQASAFYDTRMVGLRPYLEFPISETSRFMATAFVDGSNIFNVVNDLADVNPVDGLPDNPRSPLILAEAARGQQVGVGVGFGYSFDSRDNGLNPDGGIMAQLNADFGGYGADYQYAKVTALGRAHTMVLNDNVLVSATVEGGALMRSGGLSSRVTDRFWLGPDKMRGFATGGIGPRHINVAGNINDPVGGNFFAVARFEAEFPLGLPEEYNIKGGAFLDVGTVWGLDNTLGGLIDDAPHIRSVIGLALLWDTALGPLRFNFTRALAKQAYDVENRFEFTISTGF